MWIADKWADYEVMDASGGEKLERFGAYVLVRPDPQVVWDTERVDERWLAPHGHYHRSSKGGGEWELHGLPDTWTIGYKDGLYFNLRAFDFKHTGVFPEQAANWDWLAGLVKKGISPDRDVKVLNLFAYTGGATMAAAKAGAMVTHIDASKGMVAWANKNASISGLAKHPIRYMVDDCRKFVEREIRRRNLYDAVIMDPPSYGRGPNGETWKMEDDIHGLIRLCVNVLKENPIFFLVNSYTTGLQPAVLRVLLELELSGRYGGTVAADEIGLPISANGLVLPCGASGRWEKSE